MSVNIYNSNPNASSEAENFSQVASRGTNLAENIIFDNTGTDITSNDVEGAIKEVNGKVNDNADAISQINTDLSNKSGYIDASNKILNYVDLSSPVTFTEDAYVFARVWSDVTGRSAILYLDNSSIISAVAPTPQYVSFPVKAGQVLSARTDSSDYHYQATAYGML